VLLINSESVNTDYRCGVVEVFDLEAFYMSLFVGRCVASAVLFFGVLGLTNHAFAQANRSQTSVLAPGFAVVTGFSGVDEPKPRKPPVVPPLTPAQVLDKTVIDRDGVSARIVNLASPGYVWDARVWPADVARTFRARDIGQVFGVTLDDEPAPNIYVAASSVYGLHIVAPNFDIDGRPERLKVGRADARWMDGMWGAADTKGAPGTVGGPGSIWKIDGRTAEVTLFANVTLNQKANPGAGLGNITYVAALKQLFVSDLSTGMIHRFAMDGTELETFDHGVTGRASAKLARVPHDEIARLEITTPRFDTEKPDTWGLTHRDRRVWALAYHAGRLYYSVVGDSQIWSVGFDRVTGKFLNEAAWELDVPKEPRSLPVTDMLFTNKGAMILAQRGDIVSTYNYLNFAKAGDARNYRYWLRELPIPAGKSRWLEAPEEYAQGFDVDHRSTDGGIDLNYGYTDRGLLDTRVCEGSLWNTGENLRRTNDPVVRKALLPGGPLVIDGLQGIPAGPVKARNTPPWVSYLVDIETGNTEQQLQPVRPLTYSDTTTQGWIGDIAIYRPCGSGTAGGGGGASGGGGAGGGSGSYYGGAGYAWSDPPYIYTDGDWNPRCTPGVDCPPPPKSCAVPKGTFVCDATTGTLSFALALQLATGMKADTIKISGTTPGITTNGPVIPMSGSAAPITLSGAAPGQVITIPICVYDAAAAAAGTPFECCKTSVTVRVPSNLCLKK
jgi:hypothetical protein